MTRPRSTIGDIAVPLQFDVGKNARGEPVILVQSSQAIREPTLTFLVEVNWSNGRFLREYSVLLEPPVTVPVSTPSAPSSAIAPAASVQPIAEPEPAAPTPISEPEALPEPPAAETAPVETPVAETPPQAEPAPTAPEPEAVPSEPLASYDTREGFEQHRAWEAKLAEGGWSSVIWPKDLGGRGADLIEWLIFEEEYHAADAPMRVNQNGILLLGPTLMEFGTPEQKARFLPRMARCDDMWAQGWSEPNAGSDMAAISSRAIRDGDEYVLNGQKDRKSVV